MLPDADTLITPEYDLCSEMTWSAHYPRLQSLARRYVYRSYIPTWQGQEEDIIEDIVQETARRIIERTQQIEQRLAVPIYSPFHFIATIIWNYCVDLRRRDLRSVREKAALDDSPDGDHSFAFIDPFRDLVGNILKMHRWEVEEENIAQKLVQVRETPGTLPPSQGTRDKFLREAQLPEKLRHAHILLFYEFGIDDGLPYLVTQYASGGSLRGLRTSRPGLVLYR